MPKTHVRTIKLKLRIVCEDRQAAWRRLRQIAARALRAGGAEAVTLAVLAKAEPPRAYAAHFDR
jgi:hypothetical protein